MSRLTLAFGLALLALETALAVFIVATSEQRGADSFAYAIPAGVVFAISGLIALARRPENRTGVFLVGVGYLWLLNALGDSNEPWVFTLGVLLGGLVWVPFGALLLGYPTGRLETRLERAIPLAAGALLVGTSLLRLLFDPTPAPSRCDSCPESAILLSDVPAVADAARAVASVGSIVLLVLVLGALVRRWRAATPALRRLAWPVLAAAIATLVTIGLFVVADQLFPAAADSLLLAFYAVFTTVPLAFLFGVLRTRLARSSVTDVVMALETGTPLRDALATALGDPTVQIVYRIGSERGLTTGLWVDPRGWAVPEPQSSSTRAVRFIDRAGTRVAAITCDPSLLHEPELVDAVTAAAGLAISNERLQAELRVEVRFAGALSTTVPALLTNVDTDGRILKINPATLRASGYETEDDVVGRLFWEVFIDPEERDEMVARFHAAAPDFRETEYENSFVNARGEHVVIYWHSAPVLDEHGRVVSIVAGGLDITERQHREEEARIGAERLRAVIEGAPVAIVEIDLDDRVLLWNPAAERMYGWTADEVIGGPLPLVPPDREPEFRGLIVQGRAGVAYTGFETQRLRRDGELVDVELSAAPIRDATGVVVGHMAVYSDITERAERRRQAERQRDFLNSITGAVPSFLVAVDPNAVVVEHNNNRAFLDAFGWTEDEIVGKSFLGLIAREDDHSARMAIANAANGVAQPERESRWLDRSGNELLVAWSARPVLDPEGRSLVLVSGTDVTVRRRQEEELRASRARILAGGGRGATQARAQPARRRTAAARRTLGLPQAGRDQARRGPGKATSLLAGAREELTHALEELRELARGIHPAVLTDRGLGPALETLVARAPFPVELHSPEERLAPAVEAAAYYVVAESLTNVAKYARATSAKVEVAQRNGTVSVIVRDDGVGGADRDPRHRAARPRGSRLRARRRAHRREPRRRRHLHPGRSAPSDRPRGRLRTVRVTTAPSGAPLPEHPRRLAVVSPLPTGTITFFLADVEASTKLQEDDRVDYPVVIGTVRRILREARRRPRTARWWTRWATSFSPSSPSRRTPTRRRSRCSGAVATTPGPSSGARVCESGCTPGARASATRATPGSTSSASPASGRPATAGRSWRRRRRSRRSTARTRTTWASTASRASSSRSASSRSSPTTWPGTSRRSGTRARRWATRSAS